MPQLDDEYAGEVEETEGSSDFDAIPAGRYVATLREVADKDKNGETLVSGPKSKKPGTPLWNWSYTIDPEYHPKIGARVLFRRISLGETSKGMMKDAFAAFGVTAKTATEKITEDELHCVLYVKKVKWDGEWRNEVSRTLPFDPTKWTKATDLDEETDEYDGGDDSWDSDE